MSFDGVRLDNHRSELGNENEVADSLSVGRCCSEFVTARWRSGGAFMVGRRLESPLVALGKIGSDGCRASWFFDY